MSNKEIYEKMSKPEREQIERERHAILEWSIEEEKKVIENMKKEGRYLEGLDGYYPELTEIYQETKKKIKELLDRYGFKDGK